MSAVLTSPEDIVNNALVRLGVRQRIGSMYDGTPAAKIALDTYGQTRDQLLRDGDWGFARRDVVLTLMKSAPAGGYIPPTVWNNTYPAQPWSFQYLYPTDALKVRNINSSLLFLPDYLPRATEYSIANDFSANPTVKVILTNVAAPAILVYTAQVTDPSVWEVSFVESLTASLARRFAAIDPKLMQAEAADEQGETAMAKSVQG